MKVVTKRELVKMTRGTVFATVDKELWEAKELHVLLGEVPESDSKYPVAFYYQELLPGSYKGGGDHNTEDERFFGEKAIKGYAPGPTSRQATFDDDEQFVVYSEEDIFLLVTMLNKCLYSDAYMGISNLEPYDDD